MIIVSLGGGLANQMYQYTFYNWLKNKSPHKVYLDKSLYEHRVPKQNTDPIHSGYELENVFNIQGDYAGLRDIYRLSEYRYDIVRKVISKIKGRPHSQLSSDNTDNRVTYDNIDVNKDEMYYEGTFGDPRYFFDYESDIRKKFTFPDFATDANRETADKIRSCESVSIHVRRGDYLNIGQNGSAVLKMEYYSKAISYFEDRFDNVIFFVFSDDPKWCRDNFKGDNFVVVDWNSGHDAYRDMQLMSMCRHNIIANSTFSKWAARLNVNLGRVIIEPEKMNDIKVIEDKRW